MSVKKFYKLAKNELFPICRSITGNGVRKTLKIIKKNFPKLKIHEIPSGTKVFDWNVPPEWNIDDAYVIDKNNKKIIDFKKNNLHLIGYSTPINKILSKKKLFKNIHSLPKQPKAIPYITSYYKKYWGFCINHKQKLFFEKQYKNNDKFKVVIKSNFKKNGSLTYGELIIPGRSKKEILISTYVCHPSLANNELSGPIVSLCLINHFHKIKNLKKTLRFIFIPETIGSITYLSKHLEYLKQNVIGGYNLTCIGDERQYSCMLSKYENTPSDTAIIETFKKLKIRFKKYSFLERGSDERQYNSPGIDLPIASIFRTKYAKYPEYHTSLDNFSLVTERGIRGGYKVAKTAIELLLNKIIPKNNVLCEPQMGKRNLRPSLTIKDKEALSPFSFSKNLTNFLQYADGKNDLTKISKLIKRNYKQTFKIYNILKEHKLIS
jgi:aminopeptidase-like protein